MQAQTETTVFQPCIFRCYVGLGEGILIRQSILQCKVMTIIRIIDVQSHNLKWWFFSQCHRTDAYFLLELWENYDAKSLELLKLSELSEINGQFFLTQYSWLFCAIFCNELMASRRFKKMSQTKISRKHFLARKLHPPKFNMEPENDGFQEELPFLGTSFQVPC